MDSALINPRYLYLGLGYLRTFCKQAQMSHSAHLRYSMLKVFHFDSPLVCGELMMIRSFGGRQMILSWVAQLENPVVQHPVVQIRSEIRDVAFRKGLPYF